MNVITIAGNLGKDAELRHTQNGDAVASFSVADNQGKDKPVVWWRCSLWGKRADALSPYLLKGTSVTVSGSATERKWTDRDGQERVTMEIRVNDVKLQGSRDQNNEGRGDRDYGQQARTESRNDDALDDIPF